MPHLIQYQKNEYSKSKQISEIILKQVQERLGHGDIETTNKYLHCIAEADEEAANVLQDMLITKTDTQKEKHA